MLELLKDTFSPILLYTLMPILGFGLMHCLFELFDAMGIKVKKDRKWKCWSYTTAIIFLLAVLIRAFGFAYVNTFG
jgi:hypothetical protein